MVNLRQNVIKHKLQNKEKTLNIMGLANADQIDLVGPLDFDGVWIEAEHGGVDFSDISDLTRACDLWGKTSITRVHQNEAGVIYRTLDRGSQSICVPHVNTAEEAKNVVNAGKFAPIGNRGMATSRQGYGVEDYFFKANDESMLIVLIEDIEAVKNLDEILEVEGIDVFYVAPNDLAATMGFIGRSGEKEVLDTISSTLKRIVGSGRTAGTLAAPQNIDHYLDIGVNCISINIQSFLFSGIESVAKKIRE
jgi:4-hydroxy-2-oxoheptanedioate aldolase